MAFYLASVSVPYLLDPTSLMSLGSTTTTRSSADIPMQMLFPLVAKWWSLRDIHRRSFWTYINSGLKKWQWKQWLAPPQQPHLKFPRFCLHQWWPGPGGSNQSVLVIPHHPLHHRGIFSAIKPDFISNQPHSWSILHSEKKWSLCQPPPSTPTLRVTTTGTMTDIRMLSLTPLKK